MVLVAHGAALSQPLPDTNVAPLKITTVQAPKETPDLPPTPEVRLALKTRLKQARAALGAKPSTMKLAAVTRNSLTAEIDRLDRLLQPNRPFCNPVREVKRLEKNLARAAAGEAPHLQPGLHRLAYRSPLDGKLHRFAVYVPRSHGKSRRLPLVVMLHGMRSNPMRGIGRLFGVGDGRLTSARVSCDRPHVGGQDTLVVAPDAFGDTFYRLAGERDVAAVVRLMHRLYRVDRRRITITGLSMGGTGAVGIALRHPHTYAGVVALCGYYDRRLDSRIQGKPLQSWERHLMKVHSPVDWAENGRGIPIVLLHGKGDGPRRARAMARRYRQLGLSVRTELFNAGHNVWTPGYKKGRMFPVLAKFRKGGAPARVTYVSGQSRFRRGYWATIEAREDYSRWARVDAQIVNPRMIQVSTKNASRLRLDLPRHRLSKDGEVTLSIDGTVVQLPAEAGKRSRWVRRVKVRQERGKGWSLDGADAKSAGERVVKRPGLAGPIEDIYFDPILVVHGTGGGQARTLHALAKKIAGYARHASLKYRLISDRRYAPRLARRRSVVLVGNERTNRVLGRLGPRLPIRVTAGAVLVGKRRLTRPNIGATFIFPNPDSPRWYLLVVGGTTPQSYKIWRKLPAMLPDFVVFDDAMMSRRYKYVLGKRSFVAAGWFDSDWRLP